MKPDLGMSDRERKEVAGELVYFLADTYSLYLKSQNFHWNLKGQTFYPSHKLLEEHYEDLADAADEIAERVAALGHYVPASFTAFKKLSQIEEENKKISYKEMFRRLVKGHELIAKKYRPHIVEFQKLHDEISADLLIKRLAIHEKAAWMLRSHLE